MDHLDHLHTRQSPSEVVVGAAGQPVAELHGVGAASPHLFDDGVGLLQRGEQKGADPRWHRGGDFGDTLFWDHPWPTGHLGHQTDGIGAVTDGEGCIVDGFDTADLHTGAAL